MLNRERNDKIMIRWGGYMLGWWPEAFPGGSTQKNLPTGPFKSLKSLGRSTRVLLLFPSLFGLWSDRNGSGKSVAMRYTNMFVILTFFAGCNGLNAQGLSVPGNSTRPTVGTSGGLQLPSQ